MPLSGLKNSLLFNPRPLKRSRYLENRDVPNAMLGDKSPKVPKTYKSTRNGPDNSEGFDRGVRAVSYTHLTLPTIYSV